MRSEIDLKKLTVLSPIEHEWYPIDKIPYYNYITEWGLK